MECNTFELLAPRHLVVTKQSLDLGDLKYGEIAARTLASAVSPGTEMAAFLGFPPLRPGPVYPRVVGYCNVGEIIGTGDGVSMCRVGDKILTFQSHRSAFICREDKIITRIAAAVDDTQASTTYLFHLGYDALLKGNVTAGQNVAVVGLGTLGLTTVALASLFGARVFAFSDQSSSRGLAKEFGAVQSLPKRFDNVNDLLEDQTSGTGIDVIVITTNSWDDWRLALQLPRKGGRICVLGFPGRTDPLPDYNPLDSKYFYDKQLSLIACGYTPDHDIGAHDIRFTIKRNCTYLLDLISEGRLPASRLISSIVRWDELECLYEVLAERTGSFLTGVLRWN